MRESSLISKILRAVMKSEHVLIEGFQKGENKDKNDMQQGYKRILRRDIC